MGYKYSGYVYDSAGNPIDGAIVRHTCACSNTPGLNETTTTSNGYYALTLSHADTMNHHITAIAEGYAPQTQIPECGGAINYQTVGQDFHLTAVPGQLYTPVF